MKNSRKHFDPLQCFYHSIQQDITMTFTFYLIRSHQDIRHALPDLSRDEYLNVLVDSLTQIMKTYTGDYTQICSSLGKSYVNISIPTIREYTLA